MKHETTTERMLYGAELVRRATEELENPRLDQNQIFGRLIQMNSAATMITNAFNELLAERKSKRVIHMGETITVGELSNQLAVKPNIVIRELLEMGEMVTINDTLDSDIVGLIAQNFGFTLETK